MTPPLSFTVLLVVAAGGAVGSVARYGTGVWLAPVSGSFPWATLLVNVAGALLIGWLARVFSAAEANHVLRLALTAGFCGGFTTFSTFSAETVQLVQQGRLKSAALYVGLSLVLGLTATMVGLSMGGPAGAPRSPLPVHRLP
jgi:CrcB protein